jgi:uncharacterized protein YjiS (DUF1127 family)
MTAPNAAGLGRAAASGGWSPIDTLRRNWRLWASRRRTQAELSRLSIREREDIGLAGHDMRLIARAAVYGA